MLLTILGWRMSCCCPVAGPEGKMEKRRKGWGRGGRGSGRGGGRIGSHLPAVVGGLVLDRYSLWR